LFVGTNLFYNRGEVSDKALNISAPLDDTFIHLQYGSQIGEGEWFRYNDGDPVSTGASSFLYVLVLGAARLVGFWSGALIAANGAYAWGATSGMEVALFSVMKDNRDNLRMASRRSPECGVILPPHRPGVCIYPPGTGAILVPSRPGIGKVSSACIQGVKRRKATVVESPGD